MQLSESSSSAGAVTTTPHPASSLRCERIVLTGFMGAGKTTVGRLLAARLAWTFSDLDDRLEELAGATIPSLFSSHGEAHMRRLETRALARSLGQSHTVLALGGGAPETLANRLLLEQTARTTVILLTAPFPTLYDRCMLQALDPSATLRPNLMDPTEAAARFHARQSVYARMAHHIVPVESFTPTQIVDHVLSLLSHS